MSEKIPKSSTTAVHERMMTLEKSVDLITTVLYVGFAAVLIATLIGLGAILQSSLAEKTATYLNLVEKVNEGNMKIDELSNEVKVFKTLYENDKQRVIPKPTR